MKKLTNEYIVAFDCDGTIIKAFTEATDEEKAKYARTTIKTPWGECEFLVLHHVVESIKRHHMQGHYVRIWSAGGANWAETIIKSLQLEEYVDEVGSKNRWYYDDLPADSWMQRTIP